MNGVEKLDIRQVTDGTILPVKVVPGSSRDKVVGVLGSALKVATSAAPERGKANEAVTRILAKALDVDRRAIELQAGTTSAVKEFRIEGLSDNELTHRLARR
jgi:hypothetical protein